MVVEDGQTDYVFDSEPLEELWEKHTRHGDLAAREGLVLHYSSLVRFAANRLGATLPDSVDRSDLVGAGLIGLIDAVDRYEGNRGAPFESYALVRIRGAMIDDLRKMDWAPRSVRADSRNIGETMADLQHDLGRAPTDQELADALGMGVADLQRRLGEISAAGIYALDAPLSPEGPTLAETVAATENPESTVIEENVRQTALDLISDLPERDRRVIKMYFGESMTLAEIGKVLGVSESRVSQIQTRALLTLRNRMVTPTNL
ncbi:MAG: FliA/WhiG family RNA polymerase sigma factor [Acidimicrobiia bacterium]|nr:FliA/WhiG family RNA polymerase sigma factor [Acidimicrobiia bacterium]